MSFVWPVNGAAHVRDDEGVADWHAFLDDRHIQDAFRRLDRQLEPFNSRFADSKGVKAHPGNPLPAGGSRGQVNVEPTGTPDRNPDLKQVAFDQDGQVGVRELALERNRHFAVFDGCARFVADGPTELDPEFISGSLQPGGFRGTRWPDL